MSRISDPGARKFWCDVYIAQLMTENPMTEADGATIAHPHEVADDALAMYAQRFAGQALMSEIVKNNDYWQKRGIK